MNNKLSYELQYKIFVMSIVLNFLVLKYCNVSYSNMRLLLLKTLSSIRKSESFVIYFTYLRYIFSTIIPFISLSISLSLVSVDQKRKLYKHCYLDKKRRRSKYIFKSIHLRLNEIFSKYFRPHKCFRFVFTSPHNIFRMKMDAFLYTL